MCVTRYCFFVEDGLAPALAEARALGSWTAVHAAALALGVGASYHFHQGVDTHFVGLIGFGSLYARAVALRSPAATKPATPTATPIASVPLASRGACKAAALGALGFGLLGPILGLQHMSALTMYANLKHWGGSNHLLVPTSVLYDLGPVVRVEATDSATITSLLGGGDLSTSLPPAARRMMLTASPPLSARYFGFYGARMFWGREAELPGGYQHTALVDDGALAAEVAASAGDVAVAVPALEFRRILALARGRGQRFSVTYTVLPPWAKHATPATWRDYRGTAVRVVEDPVSGTRSTTHSHHTGAHTRTLPPPPPPPPVPLALRAGRHPPLHARGRLRLPRAV